MKYGLTARESDLLDFIKDAASDGWSPSYEMMMVAMGLKSKSPVHRLVVQLERKGHIARLPGRAKSIVPTDGPGPICSVCREALSHEDAAQLRAQGVE